MNRGFTTQSWRKLWAALIVLQLLAAGARAADKLSADLIPLVFRARSGAPIPVDARFKWDGARILEGRLEMEFREGARVLGRYRSGDMALTTGEQRFRMLLPPLETPFSDSQVEVRLKFVTAKEMFEPDPSVLFMPTANERSLVMGWCGARVAAQAAGIEQTLLFERFAPTEDRRKLLTTSVVRLYPEDLAAQPLAYTAFDIVVLTAEGFKEARERQLQALARWVKGGGSVCVFVAGGLQPYHLWFLNELAESSSDSPAFLSDSDGNLLPGQKKIARLHSGVGRSVVVTGDIVADPGLNSSMWREAVAHLWKMRGRQMRAVAQTGHWDASAIPSAAEAAAAQFRQSQSPRSYRPPGMNRYAGEASYATKATALGGELLNQLMPRTVRLIPFSALLAILGLFLLVIGPVDYFVLGFFRRRRYTWVMFPATSIAFMIATVLMANHYLGQRDQRRALIVVDVDKDGSALRWNRYEMIFAARDMEAVTELKDALWAPLDFRSQSGDFYNYSGQGYNYQFQSDDSQGETRLPLYDGVLPVHFRISESIRQWRPEMSRTFSFEPSPVPLLPNWRAVEAAWPNLPDIREILSASKPFTGDLYAISAPNSVTSDLRSGILAPSILEELCLGNSTGLLSLVSQLSPTGSGNFEDAGGMDPQGNASVLVIVTRAGDGIVVYRRFFHGN